MRVSNEKYSITIEVDNTYTLDSVDNRYYSKVFKLNEDIDRSYMKTFSISVAYEDKEINGEKNFISDNWLLKKE